MSQFAAQGLSLRWILPESARDIDRVDIQRQREDQRHADREQLHPRRVAGAGSIHRIVEPGLEIAASAFHGLGAVHHSSQRVPQVRMLNLLYASHQRDVVRWLHAKQADFFVNLVHDLGKGAAVTPILHVRQGIAQLSHALPGRYNAIDHHAQSAPLRSRRHAINDIQQRAVHLLVGFRLDRVQNHVDEGLRVDVVDGADLASGDFVRLFAGDALAGRDRVRLWTN